MLLIPEMPKKKTVRMTKTMAMITALVVILLINRIEAQQTLLVGDEQGWGFSPSPGFYDKWAAKHNFDVGDTLVFVFSTGDHNVARVTFIKAYDDCNDKVDQNAVIATEGPYETTFTNAGVYYFFCTIDSHCINGQKFAANVSSNPSGNSYSPPPLPLPPPSAGARCHIHRVFSCFVIFIILYLFEFA